MVLIAGIFCCVGSARSTQLYSEDAVVEYVEIIPEEPSTQAKILQFQNDILVEEPEETVELMEEVVEEEPESSEPVDETVYYDAIPLTNDEQRSLLNACKEYSVPYALALGLIDTETRFSNIYGDNGNSHGYMQIQPRWHGERMSRLGVPDLMVPEGNFMVGLDYLSELYRKYGDWGAALTAYNRGSYPGYYTYYAYDVLSNRDRWQNVVGVE